MVDPREGTAGGLIIREGAAGLFARDATGGGTLIEAARLGGDAKYDCCGGIEGCMAGGESPNTSNKSFVTSSERYDRVSLHITSPFKLALLTLVRKGSLISKRGRDHALGQDRGQLLSCELVVDQEHGHCKLVLAELSFLADIG